jgi:hypothetical protein
MTRAPLGRSVAAVQVDDRVAATAGVPRSAWCGETPRSVSTMRCRSGGRCARGQLHRHHRAGPPVHAGHSDVPGGMQRQAGPSSRLPKCSTQSSVISNRSIFRDATNVPFVLPQFREPRAVFGPSTAWFQDADVVDDDPTASRSPRIGRPCRSVLSVPGSSDQLSPAAARREARSSANPRPHLAAPRADDAQELNRQRAAKTSIFPPPLWPGPRLPKRTTRLRKTVRCCPRARLAGAGAASAPPWDRLRHALPPRA